MDLLRFTFRAGTALLTTNIATARAEPTATLRSTPHYVATSRDLGPVDTSQIIDVTIWLAPHDRAAMDALAHDLYDSTSPRYQHFLTSAQLAARFAPTAREAETVRQFFISNHLEPVLTGGSNFFVRARGTVGNVQQAFHVALHDFSVNGKAIRANTTDPTITGPAAALASAVYGLDSNTYTHPLRVQTADASIPVAAPAHPLTAADSGFFTSQCFTTGRESLSTNNNGSLPVGHFAGSVLHLTTATSAGCGYTPGPLYTAYDMKQLFNDGFTGKGQTISIVDWCGSSTVESDANVFSRRFGLPQLTSSNFNIVYTPAPSSCIAEDQVEINLDVEWAHAFAPGANIVLVVPPSATLQDVDEGIFYAVNNNVGNSLSGSFGSPEDETPSSYLQTENLIAEMASVEGMSTNFSSGDSGDFVFNSPQTVNAPADSPWATSVGGVSLAVTSKNEIAWQTGWGTNRSVLAENGAIFDPPEALGFTFGSGGGASTCATQDSNGNCLAGFPKPSFQQNLSGTTRLVPDISWLADPYTGAVISITVPNQSPARVWETVGGTSLAAPMFSALWAIANEEAGKSLGQAAPYLYKMKAAAITDIVPVVGSDNAHASVQEPGKLNVYSPRQTIGGGPSTLAPNSFVSALWNVGNAPGTVAVVSFGTDCVTASGFLGTPCIGPHALRTKIGWDDVTGLGVPDGRVFANSFRSKSVSPE